MNLICPHCQKQLTLADEHAGQILKCPHCSAMFMAPALPTLDIPGAAPAASPPAPTAAAEQQAKVGPREGAPEVPAPPSAPPAEKEPEVLPPGEFTKVFTIRFNPNFLAWCPPVGFGLIFLLSLFPWYASPPGTSLGGNLWVLAFAGSSNFRPLFASYILFTFFLALPLAIASFLFGKKIIPVPPPLKKLRPWRSLVVACAAAPGFLLVFYDFLACNFKIPVNLMTIWYDIAFKLHFLIIVALLLEFWLERRRQKDLPWPKIDLRW